MHAVALSCGLLAATVALLVQVSNADHAVTQLHHDDQAVISPVDSATSGR